MAEQAARVISRQGPDHTSFETIFYEGGAVVSVFRDSLGFVISQIHTKMAAYGPNADRATISASHYDSLLASQ